MAPGSQTAEKAGAQTFSSVTFLVWLEAVSDKLVGMAGKLGERWTDFVNTNFKLVESLQVSWPTERRNFRKKDGSFCLESEMSRKRRRQREPKATGRIAQISPSAWWDLQLEGTHIHLSKQENGLLGPRPKCTTLSPRWECNRGTKRQKMRPMVAQEPFGAGENR